VKYLIEALVSLQPYFLYRVTHIINHATTMIPSMTCLDLYRSRSNPGGGRDFPHPSRPALRMVTMSFPGVKWPRRDVYHPPPSSADVNERVELYLYSPSGPSWPVLR
jgi:hypothetical protein